MIQYRIYTEDKNRDTIINYVSKEFDGFTVYTGVGYWRGRQEDCLVIEILGGEAEIVRKTAHWICRNNSQESVAIVKQEVEVETAGESL